MTPSSLDTLFIPAKNDASALRSRPGKRPQTPEDIIKALLKEPFDTAYDLLRLTAREALQRGEASKAVTLLGEIEIAITAMDDSDRGQLLDLRAALMQVITALYVAQGDYDQGAASAAATTLQLLAQEPRRKDIPFMEILATLLYDLAYLHSERGEYKQAERDMEKAVRLFERLAKYDADRYAAAVMTALSAATDVYRNRVKQAELLAHYQAATSTYMEMLSAGMTEAADRLADSLSSEGDTLARMGRHREAVQYYTRALKTLQKTEADFTVRQLRLSIAMGRSMLAISAMKDKGIHLLNTMLHKALKVGAQEEHQLIGDILAKAKTAKLDILGLWHKVFPK